jgi:hypothetical protein
MPLRASVDDAVPQVGKVVHDARPWRPEAAPHRVLALSAALSVLDRSLSERLSSMRALPTLAAVIYFHLLLAGLAEAGQVT